MQKWTAEKSAQCEAFSREAAAFCSFLDKHKDYGRQDFLRQCHRRLSKIHALALELPEAEETSEDNPEADVDAHADALYKEIGEKLGQHDVFWVVFNPYAKEEPIQASIADGLRGIYLDLQDGLKAFSEGAVQDAAWSWKFSHQTSWGKHVAETLVALQEVAGGDYVVG